MTKVVTPPNILTEPPVYLIVNAPVTDIEILSFWLRIEEKDYTIHLYHSEMNYPEWLETVAAEADIILIHKANTTANQLEPILDYVSKIIWFGTEDGYVKAIDYFLDHDRTK